MDFFKKMLSDVDGQTSSKRFISFLSFLVMVGSWVGSQFFGKPVEDVLQAFMYIVVVGLGVTAAEKFSKK
jgi:hypothetical protein